MVIYFVGYWNIL